MVLDFIAKPQQGVTSILVNRTRFLSSVLVPSLVQSFLFDFADIYNSENCSKSPLLFDCFGQVSSNSLCNRRTPRFDRLIMTIALLSDSMRVIICITACFEKGGTKGREGKCENVTFGIAAYFVFN